MVSIDVWDFQSPVVQDRELRVCNTNAFVKIESAID